MERWLSGLRQRFTKPPFSYENRGFESHSLRKTRSELASDYVLRECILQSEANPVANQQIRISDSFC